MVRLPLVPAGYISTEQAALRSGYTMDYLAGLARLGRLRALRVGQK
jgi:hypothetical protein